MTSTATTHKRPHPDEIVVLDDDDETQETTSRSLDVPPTLPHMDDTPSPTIASSPASKRIRPDSFPAAVLPAAASPVHSPSKASASVHLPPVPSPSPPPVVSSYNFTGLYQPHRFLADETDENKYVLAAAYVLSITLKWNDTHSTAALQGRISWRYALLWLNFDALIDDRQTLFWDVARQSETVTGQAQLVHERSVKGGRADGGSDEQRLRLIMTTRELLPIDAAISQFHDEGGDEDETANQVQYTLQQFERQRRYMLEIAPDTSHLTGTITMQLQPTFGDRKDEADDDDEDGRQTAVVGWACDEDDVDTANELQPVQRVHHAFVARMLDIITTQQLSVDVVDRLRGILDKLLREPEVEGSKFRRINRTTIGYKFGEGVVDVLKLCGWVDEEVEHQGQKYIVLPDDADLLLVATMRRALPS